jgi:hypothetical protein
MLMAMAIVPAGAQLTSIAYGFPSIFQTGSTTAFSRDLVTAQDLESVNIDFGAAGLYGLGCGGFPSISQTVDQSYYAEHTDFYHTEETAAFNYPFVGLGSACGYGLPGLDGLAGLGLPYGYC